MNNLYGLSFPIILDNGTPAQPGLKDSIDSSIRAILAWSINERDFNSTFGSILESLLGAPNAQTSKNAIGVFVTKAIAEWEQRITVTGTDVEQDGEYLRISINATINETQTAFTYQILV